MKRLLFFFWPTSFYLYAQVKDRFPILLTTLFIVYFMDVRHFQMALVKRFCFWVALPDPGCGASGPGTADTGHPGLTLVLGWISRLALKFNLRHFRSEMKWNPAVIYKAKVKQYANVNDLNFGVREARKLKLVISFLSEATV